MVKLSKTSKGDDEDEDGACRESLICSQIIIGSMIYQRYIFYTHFQFFKFLFFMRIFMYLIFFPCWCFLFAKKKFIFFFFHVYGNFVYVQSESLNSIVINSSKWRRVNRIRKERRRSFNQTNLKSHT